MSAYGAVMHQPEPGRKRPKKMDPVAAAVADMDDDRAEAEEAARVRAEEEAEWYAYHREQTAPGIG